MTNEENYCFDVAEYLHVPGTLTRPEVEWLNREIDVVEAVEGMLGWPGRRGCFYSDISQCAAMRQSPEDRRPHRSGLGPDLSGGGRTAGGAPSRAPPQPQFEFAA